MKYKIVPYPGGTDNTFIILSRRAMLYCRAAGYKLDRMYDGHEVEEVVKEVEKEVR